MRSLIGYLRQNTHDGYHMDLMPLKANMKVIVDVNGLKIPTNTLIALAVDDNNVVIRKKGLTSFTKLEWGY